MKRVLFCQKERKKINSMNIVSKSQHIYPIEFLENQKPEEEKYRFNVVQYQKHVCPSCGGNCVEFVEE